MNFDWQAQVFKIPLIGNACSLATLNMRRVHAFEFNDLSWFPISFRNAATDFLQFVANRFDIYKNILPVIEKEFKAVAIIQSWIQLQGAEDL